jgi:hypothetical protein
VVEDVHDRYVPKNEQGDQDAGDSHEEPGIELKV